MKEYRFIVESIETIPGIKHLVLSQSQLWQSRETSINGDTYLLSEDHFDSLRRAIDRIHDRALELARIDKANLTNISLLRDLDGIKIPQRHRPYPRNTIYRAVAGGQPNLSDRDRVAAVNLVRSNRRALADRHPEQLLALQRDIELVSLEQLIQKLEALMTKGVPEAQWQRLFIDNPFILSLAFGLPVVAVGDQLSVGGRTFVGTGEKIADFLVKNDLTDNLALIEIKTPGTTLLGRPYRDAVFPPSTHLSGAVTQVLDQRYKLQAELNTKKANTRRYDLEAYAIRCVVIIGTMPEDPDQKKSLELFRNNLHDTLVITFDELLSKLKHLHHFLLPQESQSDRV